MEAVSVDAALTEKIRRITERRAVSTEEVVRQAVELLYEREFPGEGEPAGRARFAYLIGAGSEQDASVPDYDDPFADAVVEKLRREAREARP